MTTERLKQIKRFVRKGRENVSGITAPENARRTSRRVRIPRAVPVFYHKNEPLSVNITRSVTPTIQSIIVRIYIADIVVL